MAYSTNRSGNIFTINNTGLDPLYVTVYKETYCSSDVWVEIFPTQTVTTLLSITLPTNDTTYKIHITDNFSIDDDVLVPVYNALFKAMITDINKVVCGCPCSTCEDCGITEKDYLSTISKILSYNMLIGLYLQPLLETSNCIKCDIVDTTQCILLNDKITGTSDSKELLKKLIIYYYLVFYYTDLYTSINPSTISTLYDYNNIEKCIKKLNIDINCIKDTIYQLYQ
jgi:hypothetical protein